MTLITVPIRKLNMRLFYLFERKANGTITRAEQVEYVLMCAVDDAGQDNYEEVSCG